MVTLGTKLDEKKGRFERALKMQLDEKSKTIIKNAIDSVNYIKLIYRGKVILPSLEEDANSNWGKVHEWFAGSIRNIDKADELLVKIQYSESGLADEVNGCDDDGECHSESGLADEVNGCDDGEYYVGGDCNDTCGLGDLCDCRDI